MTFHMESGEEGSIAKSCQSEGYEQTFAGLVDKYLTYILSGRNIPSFVVFLVMGWVFVQDNRAGRLQDWHDIFWTAQKCLFFVLLYLVLQLIRFVSQSFSK